MRYNAGLPRLPTLGGSMQLADWSGEGRVDLLGCWNYYRRPGEPVSGVVCYPRCADHLCFGDMVRPRYRDKDGGGWRIFRRGPSLEVPFADIVDVQWVDVDGDGKPDLIGCVEWSFYPFFAHAALQMSAHPKWHIERVQAV